MFPKVCLEQWKILPPAVAESRQKADALVESLGFEKSRKKGRMKGYPGILCYYSKERKETKGQKKQDSRKTLP